MRVALSLAAILLLPAASHAQAQPRSESRVHCADSAKRSDSTFVIRQAIRALKDSSRDSTVTLKVDDYLVIKTPRVIATDTLEQGVIVNLVPANPSISGGGGLVWVAGETLCPMVVLLWK